MDGTQLVVLPDLPVPSVDGRYRGDVAERGVRWLADRYSMSEAFARILLTQLARQDGVTEAAAARSLLATAAIDAGTPTSTP